MTASNEAQATAYRNQIENRLEKGLLPEETTYAVLPDPEGKRVGSGGATFQVMRYIAEQEPERENPFKNRRILVIHSGGDSKRVPQYSAIGKLFSPVPRELPDGRSSTLFDEFIVGMSGVPSRIQEGMLVLSGDVLLLFNPLQIDAQFDGAAAISIKEPVATGKNHGVFLNDGHDYVKCFLHKQTEERLREMGAVNNAGNVDLDTGAVLFGSALLQALFRLISTGGKVDEKKFRQFCNEKARISFYGDFFISACK
ncbi:MAG: L-fucokinase [Mediterraneibacter faecis]